MVVKSVEAVRPDWASPDWSYLLGVIHGDGHIGTREVQIAVGYRDAEYAHILVALLRKMGFRPHIYRGHTCLTVTVCNVVLTRVMSRWKQHGRWRWPDGLDPLPYIAGVIDTDGCVSKAPNNVIVVTLKRSGNLRRFAEILREAGVRDVHVSNLVSKWRGKPYPIEKLQLSGGDRILWASKHIPLRHPFKKKRLAILAASVEHWSQVVPTWVKLGRYLESHRATAKEAGCALGLTRVQVWTALHKLRERRVLDTEIPPPTEAVYSVKQMPEYSRGPNFFVKGG
jgi:hypothetical protein